MNKKQCPKCGEENPAEAVMCWACYTPLSGAIPSAGGTPRSGGAAPATGEQEEKQKIPPWQLGVIGVGLLVVVGMGVRSMMPAAPTEGGEFTDPPLDPAADPAMQAPVGGPAPAPAPGPPSSPGGGESVTPKEAPFKIVVAPNPRLAVATMAIVTKDATSGSVAAQYAAHARRRYNGRARTLYIYVFSDTQSAQAFGKIMRQRRGVALGDGDYSALSSLWGSALARYEYTRSGNGGRERVLYPSKNPSGWWYGR